MSDRTANAANIALPPNIVSADAFEARRVEREHRLLAERQAACAHDGGCWSGGTFSCFACGATLTKDEMRGR